MENENKARRFRVVVTDLQEDKKLMDVTTGAAMVTAASVFDHLTGEDKISSVQNAHYFECKAEDILVCIKSTINGIGKLCNQHREIGLLLQMILHSDMEDKDNE